MLTQTYTNYEVIVVDDGSTDDSLAVTQKFINERLESKGRVIHKENGGVSSARNRGIQEAKYDYIALLDGDDLWGPTCLEEQVQLIKDFPKAAMWGVNTAFIKNNQTHKWEQGMGDGYRGYVENYFGTKQERLDSDVIVRKLRYQDIHSKYKWIFKTPRCLGRLLYKMVCLKKNIIKS